jgi:hypothetical protein
VAVGGSSGGIRVVVPRSLDHQHRRVEKAAPTLLTLQLSREMTSSWSMDYHGLRNEMVVMVLRKE